MVNYREILRLHSLKYTQRQIAASVHSSRNTISEVLHLADEIGLDWPLDDSVYIPLSVSTLHGHLVHGFRPLSASIPVC